MNIDYFIWKNLDDLSEKLRCLVLLLLVDLKVSFDLDNCSLIDISYSTFFVANSLFSKTHSSKIYNLFIL